MCIMSRLIFLRSEFQFRTNIGNFVGGRGQVRGPLLSREVPYKSVPTRCADLGAYSASIIRGNSVEEYFIKFLSSVFF